MVKPAETDLQLRKYRKNPKSPQIDPEYRKHSNFRYLDHLQVDERSKLAEGFEIGVTSEVGTLRKVFLHSPGREVELMTPKTASELLYNDIIHFRQVQSGHQQLKGVLSIGAQVLEVLDCLETVLEDAEVREMLCLQVTSLQDCIDVLPDLRMLSAHDLAQVFICGLPLKRNSLERYLSQRSFSLLPMPNMYFMRDSSMVIGNRVVTGAMASSVRTTEALIMRSIFEHHPSLKGNGILLDTCALGADKDITLEGGDCLVVNPDVLLIGISERTTPQSVDLLVDALVRSRHTDGNTEPFNVLCVVLPRERSTIHLDMIFTIVNLEQAVVYPPYILGRERARVVRIRVNAQGERKFAEIDDLLLGLRSVGVRIDPILCGGDVPLHQSREQWNSGANMFAFGPGKVLSYAMHEHTAAACQAAGFSLIHANEVIAKPELLRSSLPMVVLVDGTELARGGGGPRCMTCPVLRESIP